MKQMLVAILAGGAAYFLIGKFLIKREDGGGFIPLSDGFGLDDIALGGGAALAAMSISKIV